MIETNHSLSVDLARGLFFDHEAGEGGGVLDLIQRELGLTGRGAYAWLERHVGLETCDEQREDRPQSVKRQQSPEPLIRCSPAPVRLLLLLKEVDTLGSMVCQSCYRLMPKSSAFRKWSTVFTLFHLPRQSAFLYRLPSPQQQNENPSFATEQKDCRERRMYNLKIDSP